MSNGVYQVRRILALLGAVVALLALSACEIPQQNNPYDDGVIRSWESAMATPEKVVALSVYHEDSTLDPRLLLLPNLRTLHLSGEKLTYLAPVFRQLTPTLNHIGIMDANIRSIPDSECVLKNLEWFIIKNCPLEAIPDAIDDFASLYWLTIWNTRVHTLPNSIARLTYLEYLTLCDNHLRQLPDSIGLLKNLKHLDLQNNDLDSLPESIVDLESLYYLDVSGNALKAMPANLEKLTRLRDLYLSGNPLPEAEKQRIRKKLPWVYIKF